MVNFWSKDKEKFLYEKAKIQHLFFYLTPPIAIFCLQIAHLLFFAMPYGQCHTSILSRKTCEVHGKAGIVFRGRTAGLPPPFFLFPPTWGNTAIMGKKQRQILHCFGTWSKIGRTYFKIQGTYFKLCALYFFFSPMCV